MIDFLAHVCLNLTHQSFLLPFILIGYFKWNKEIFCKALFILLFTMVLNAYLKSLWQIPLAPALKKEGWAFPSGHMQSAVAFWGWLAWEFKEIWFSIFVAVLLMTISFALIYFGYHNYYDIVGALIFGILSLIAYEISVRYFNISKNNLYRIGLLLFTLALPLIYSIPLSLPHLWIAEGALLGFSLGNFFSPNTQCRNVNLKFIISILGAYLIYKFFSYLILFKNLKLNNFIQFFLIGVWISYTSEKLSNKFEE